MKTGEAAKLLDVAINTVKNWIDHPSVVDYFSPGARGVHGGSQRVLIEADILILNTIRHLRNIDSVTDWDEIAVRLSKGEREQEFPQNAISADPRTIPLPQAEQSVKAAATLAERDAALERVQELEDRLTEIEQEKEEIREKLTQELNETREKLLREIAALNREVGKAYHEGYLDAMRKQDDKDD